MPVTFAVLHQGFPVTDPDLRARDVWVTNGQELLAGRLNRQIEELDAAVATASNDVDVFQDGDDVFLLDAGVGSIERIDPSFTTLTQRIDVPLGSRIAYGGDVLAILSPKGQLWTTPAGGDLSFDAGGTDPVAELGADARVAVSDRGTVFATSAADDELVRIDAGGGEPAVSPLPKLGAHQVAAIGERAVVFDEDRNVVVVDGRDVPLPEAGLKLQQSSAEHDVAYVAGASELMAVPLGGGDALAIESDAAAAPARAADEVAAPVWVNGCAHAAWATSSTYLAACDGSEPSSQSIEQPTAGSRLEFRVNRDVVVLNDLSNGNAWLVDSDLRLVDNWEEVTPPEETDELEGDEKSAQQTFEDTLAERTDVNRPPLARDDEAGVRPGRTTVLEVLENDTDPDGDVLTIAETSEVAASQGRLEVIDGGRALQLTPADGAAGTISFRYSVEDGRSGVSEASVDVRIVPETENVAPTSLRSGAVSVEQGQQISYNVLADWNDPDGDDVFLVNASPTSGDSVRFSPDGYVTFDHKSGELGLKEVAFTVSDGQLTAAGTLTVDVKPAGTLNPVGTPDFAQVFAGEATLIEPLENDLTPSGAPLALLGVDQVPTGASVTPNPERGTIAFSSNEPGEYIFLYNVGADAAVSVGLVRVQVVEPPAEAPPPIAVKDTAYLRPGEPTSVPVLANDVSPSGRVLAVQSADDTETDDLVSVEILTNTVARVTASEALDRQLQFSYTISDGVNTATATVTVVPVPPLVKHQPPVAVDDAVNVRAGDIATVPVLANDYHPDSTAIHVLPELADTGALQGLAFVDDDHVRFQAPDEPGTYTAVYTIGDDFEQTARANVAFTVVAKDAGENRPPLPTPLTSRTFAGSAVSIDIPLDGLDPDGDSVVLTGISSAPNLGRIAERTSTSITYEAFAGSTGTDTFGYELRDAFGATAKGTIRIGVIPRPAVALPPKAVDDAIEVKPGRTASVEVLAQRLRPERLQPEGRRPARGRRGHRGRDPRQAPGRRHRARPGGRVHDPLRDLERARRRRHRVPAGRGEGRREGAAADRGGPGHRARGGRRGRLRDRAAARRRHEPRRARGRPRGHARGAERRSRRGDARRRHRREARSGALRRRVPPHQRARRALGDGVRDRAAVRHGGGHRGGRAHHPRPAPRRPRPDRRADERQHPMGCRRPGRRPLGQAGAGPLGLGGERPVGGLRRRVHAAVRARAGLPRRGIRHLRGHRRAQRRRPRRTHGPAHPAGDGRRPGLRGHAARVHPACRDDRGGGAAARDRPALIERPPEPRRHRPARVLEPRRHDRRRPGLHRRGRAAGLRTARRAAGHGHATHLRRDVQRVHGAGLRRREGRVVDPGEGAGRRRRTRVHEAQRDRHDRRARERLQPVPRGAAEGDRAPRSTSSTSARARPRASPRPASRCAPARRSRAP